MAKKIFMVRFEPEQLKWLKQEAKRRKTTIAEIIRELVDYEFSKYK